MLRGETVPQYRMLLLDLDGSIQAIDQFGAENDDTAKAVGAVLWDVCSDHFGGYVLWGPSRRLASVHKSQGAALKPPLDALSKRIQRLVLEREETLQQSRLRVANSKRLLQVKETLRRFLKPSRH